jgi:hypothetical protein
VDNETELLEGPGRIWMDRRVDVNHSARGMFGLRPENRHENELESATGRRRTNEGEPVQRRADHRDFTRA